MPTPFVASSTPDQDKQFFKKTRADLLDERRANDLARMQGKLPQMFEYLEASKITWKDQDFDDMLERSVADPLVQRGSSDYADSLVEKGSLLSNNFGKVEPRLVRQAVTELIKSTGNISINPSTCSPDTTVWVTLAITDSVDASRTLFALSEATAYEDTVAAANHIIQSPALDRMHLFHKHDFTEDVAVPGRSHLYFYGIHNDDVSSHDYKCFVRMRFVGRAASSA